MTGPIGRHLARRRAAARLARVIAAADRAADEHGRPDMIRAAAARRRLDRLAAAARAAVESAA